MDESSSTASVVALERAEIRAWGDVFRTADERTAAAGGLSVTEVAGCTVIAANKIDVLAMNRVIGLGVDGPPSQEVLEEVFATFQRLGSPRFFIPVAPVPQNEGLAERLETLGASHYNNWMRLSRDLRRLPDDPGSGPEVRPIGPDAAAPFAEIVSGAFGYPSPIQPATAATIGHPGWFHYLAYEGETPIAAAAMHVMDETAWFGFAATREGSRRHGAQSALVARRMRDAAEAGCTLVSVETAEQTVKKDAPSFRNLRRLGFEVAYKRPNHIWLREDA